MSSPKLVTAITDCLIQKTLYRPATSRGYSKMASYIVRRSFSANVKRFISNLENQTAPKTIHSNFSSASSHTRTFTSLDGTDKQLFGRNFGHLVGPQIAVRCLSLSERRSGEGEGQANCWKCGEKTQHLFFCDKCGVIQPAHDVNYFHVLGLPVKFDLDTADLTQRFRQLQRLLHPDKFTQKSQTERSYSDDQSSLVNKSYQTLLKPLPRGLYLLKLNGASLEEGEIHQDPAFLMEIMESNEELAAPDITSETVRRMGAENRRTLNELMAEAAGHFSEGNIPSAKETLARLKYYANIDDKVQDLEAKFAEGL